MVTELKTLEGRGACVEFLISNMMYFVDLILHVDQYLKTWSELYGPWIYLLLFVIVFCETGLIVTPFLPGDSLLFAAGALTALPQGGLSYALLSVLLITAAFAGDQVNYNVGRYAGSRVLSWTKGRWVNPDHLRQTEEFMARYGAFAIVMARFAPIVRTFAPFVAGVGKMDRKKFLFFNFAGAVLWVQIFLALGFFFGNLPAVQKNFSLVIVVIVLISVLPLLWGWLKSRTSSRQIL